VNTCAIAGLFSHTWQVSLHIHYRSLSIDIVGFFSHISYIYRSLLTIVCSLFHIHTIGFFSYICRSLFKHIKVSLAGHSRMCPSLSQPKTRYIGLFGHICVLFFRCAHTPKCRSLFIYMHRSLFIYMHRSLFIYDVGLFSYLYRSLWTYVFFFSGVCIRLIVGLFSYKHVGLFSYLLSLFWHVRVLFFRCVHTPQCRSLFMYTCRSLLILV